MRPIQQSAVAECGLACAAMMLEAYGKPTTLQQLRKTHDASVRGSSLRDLLGLLGDYGLLAQPLRLEVEKLEKVTLPCILHWSFDHFVVLEHYSKKSAVIIDPASGRRVVSTSELNMKFTGIAITVTDKVPPRIKVVDSKRISLTDVLPRPSSLVTLLVQIVALSCILNIGTLVLPIFAKNALNSIGSGAFGSWFFAVALAFLLLGVLQGANRYARGASLIDLRRRLSSYMARGVFGQLIWLNHAVVERRSAGTLAANYRSVFAVSDTLGDEVVSALIDALGAVFVVGILFYYDWLIGFLTLLPISVYVLWTVNRNGGAKTKMSEVLAQEGREGGFFVETVNRLQAIRLFQAEPWRTNAFATIHSRVEDARDQYARWLNTSRAVGEALLQAGWVVIVAVGAYRIFYLHLGIGLFSALIVWVGLATMRARDAVTRLAQLDWLGSHVDRLSDIILSPSDMIEKAWEVAGEPPQSIGCSGATVRYAPSLPPVLIELSFDVKIGEWVTIVGASGEGKTTLAKALTGLLPLETGSLLINGAPVPVEQVRTIRHHVGAVMQNDGLFAGSIRDNISFFDQMPDLDLISQCAATAEIDTDIAKMSMQFDSVIGEQGAGLSAGQGQRLMLARALYKRPRFLVLDEFTSNIDEDCERRIIINIRGLGLGVIAIAHRSNVIDAADRVLELNGCRLTERKRRGELRLATKNSNI